MPRRSGIIGPPNSYVDGSWLDGEVKGPEAVGYAQEISRRLVAVIGDRSLREVARGAGLDHTTVSAIISGERWADLVTLAKLETVLQVRLWPEGPVARTER